MAEKREEKKMAVACPLCLKKGKQSKVRLMQMNYTEALVCCEDAKCPFPLLEGHLASNIVRRDFRNMKDDVPVEVPASDDSNNGSEISSPKEPASIDGEEDNLKNLSNSDVSDAPHTTAVINTSASNSEVMDNDTLPKFEFTTSNTQQRETKGRRNSPKRKYYTGCRKKKNSKKPSPKTENVSIEPEA